MRAWRKRVAMDNPEVVPVWLDWRKYRSGHDGPALVEKRTNTVYMPHTAFMFSPNKQVDVILSKKNK